MVLESTVKPVVTIDQQIAELFNNNFGTGSSWNWGNLLLCLIAMILCVVLCGAIGLEREKRGRSAGLRTHLLVGLGSCLVMIISIYGFPAMFTDFGGVASRDVARLAAGIITGVGFLGAGAIIHNSGGIKGLTTAGTIWIAMAIGLACGSMNFVLALCSFIVIMLILVAFRRLERVVTRKNPQFIVVAKSDAPLLPEVLRLAEEFHCDVEGIKSKVVKSGDREMIEFFFKLNVREKMGINATDFMSTLKERTKAESVEILNGH